MRSSWIMTVAAVCGVAAFFYTLAAGSTATRRGRGWRNGDTASRANAVMNTRQMTPLPQNIADLEDYIKSNPRGGRSGRAYFELARRYEEADRSDDARRAWEQAAELRLAAVSRSGENPDLWFEAGWALWKLGRLDEARSRMEEAEQRYSAMPTDNRTAATWHRLGWARKIMGQDQDAAIAWSRARDAAAVRTDGWEAGRLYDLACYQSLLGEKEAALASFEGAATAGWADANRALHDDDLKLLRDEGRFLEALRKMREAPQGLRIGPG